MQCTSKLLTALSGQGLTVSLVGDKLKVEPRRLITDEVKGFIGQHKTEIIEALSTGAGAEGGSETLPPCNDVNHDVNHRRGDETYAQKGGGQVEPVNGEVNTIPVSVHTPTGGEQSAPNSRGCFQCGHYDGKGAAWPGKCRFFETIGQAPKEIDFTVVDPLTGCKCFMARSVDAGANNFCLICGFPLDQDGGDCWHRDFHLGITTNGGNQYSEPSELRGQVEDNPEMDAGLHPTKMTSPKISPAAVAWLQDHKQELKAAGWPASQLWRRNRSPGIAWSPMWTKSFLKVTLLESAAIEFEFIENGRDVINKAYPMPQRSIKRSTKI